MIQVDQEEGGHVNGESEQKHSTTVVLYETLAGQTEQQAAEYGTTADKATVNADQFDRVITERLRVADGRWEHRWVERQLETCGVGQDEN